MAHHSACSLWLFMTVAFFVEVGFTLPLTLSPLLSGDFSFLSFKPHTEADLWNAVSKVNNRTRALLFDRNSNFSENAVAKNNTQDVILLINRIFANNLTGTEPSAMGKGATPTDPTTVTKNLDPSRWEEQLYNYQRGMGETYIEGLQAQNMAILMKVSVTEQMLSAGAKPGSVYPKSQFVYKSAPVGENWMATWTFVESAALLYQDLLYSFELFGYWSVMWGQLEERNVPGTEFWLRKRNRPTSPFQELGRGSLQLQAQPRSANFEGVGTS